MNHFTQYIPNFCSGFEPIEFDFDTVDELLSHDVCQHFAKTERTKFCLYSAKDTDRIRYAIIAVRNDEWWWNVGFVEEPVDLPPWLPPSLCRPPKCTKCHDTGTYIEQITGWVEDPTRHLFNHKLPLVKETRNVQMQCPRRKSVDKRQN